MFHVHWVIFVVDTFFLSSFYRVNIVMGSNVSCGHMLLESHQCCSYSDNQPQSHLQSSLCPLLSSLLCLLLLGHGYSIPITFAIAFYFQGRTFILSTTLSFSPRIHYDSKAWTIVSGDGTSVVGSIQQYTVIYIRPTFYIHGVNWAIDLSQIQTVWNPEIDYKQLLSCIRPIPPRHI